MVFGRPGLIGLIVQSLVMVDCLSVIAAALDHSLLENHAMVLSLI